MSEVRPRIIGSEMEWPLTVESHDGRKTQLAIAYGGMDDFIHPDVRIANSMTSNGARFYVDMGDHLEYATPEDTQIKNGVVANEMAGELFVIDSLMRKMKKSESIAKLYVSKRVIDSRQSTWGYHINLSTKRDIVQEVDDESMHLLGLHLATSQPLLGAGMVYQSPTGWRYSYSQKMSSIVDAYGIGTTVGRRALVNTRDESLSPSPYDRRVHITSTDAHISPWATAMSFATVSLVLRAIEQGKAGGLRLDDTTYGGYELAALAKISMTDLEMKNTSLLTDGRKYTNLEIQKKILEIIDRVECTDEESYYRTEWRRAVEDIERDVLLLEDRSDAIAKLGLLRAAQQRLGCDENDWENPRLQLIDNAYGHIAVITRDSVDDTKEVDAESVYSTSTSYALRERKFSPWLPDTQIVRERITTPPSTTRAAVRGHLIGQYIVNDADWGEVLIGGDTPQYVTLKPYDNEIKEYGKNARRNY